MKVFIKYCISNISINRKEKLVHEIDFFLIHNVKSDSFLRIVVFFLAHILIRSGCYFGLSGVLFWYFWEKSRSLNLHH